MKAMLLKISSNHNHISDNPYVGECQYIPIVGGYFEFEYDGGYLYVTTVTDVRETMDGFILFTTKNSRYLLCII